MSEKVSNTNSESVPVRHRRPILALGKPDPDGKIVITDVLCVNFPDMSDDDMASLSRNLHQWRANLRRR